MNRGDCKTIAKAMNAAGRSEPYRTQTKASAWAFFIDELADALAQCSSDHFNREEFLATCRGGGAPSVGQNQEIEP